jgi:uncharacterized protein YcaQ
MCRYHWDVPPDRGPAAERTISMAVARRFLALRHGLAPPRSLPAEPASVMRVVDRLGSLQFDPLEVAGRNHDLVLLARIDGYRREWTDRLLYQSRDLYETYNKGLSLVPTAELPLYRITWDHNRAEHDGNAFDEHAPLVQELLDRIRSNGPMSSTDVEPRAAIDWYWRPTNPVRALLEALGEAGILGLARRDGNRRIYDLVERLFPAELLADRRSPEEQRRHKLLSRFRAHGLLGTSGQSEIWVGTAPVAGDRGGVAATTTADRAGLRGQLVDLGLLTPIGVEGLRTHRFVMSDEVVLLDQAVQEVATGRSPNDRPPGVAFLAPLDPLVWDRQLLRPLFGFDYVWEVYVPAAKRRWGYYVLPIWFGDRFVGRIEPRIDRQARTLRILGLWWEDGFDPLAEPGFVEAFAGALEAHRRFGDVRTIRLPRHARHRSLAAAIRASVGDRTGTPTVQGEVA